MRFNTSTTKIERRRRAFGQHSLRWTRVFEWNTRFKVPQVSIQDNEHSKWPYTKQNARKKNIVNSSLKTVHCQTFSQMTGIGYRVRQEIRKREISDTNSCWGLGTFGLLHWFWNDRQDQVLRLPEGRRSSSIRERSRREKEKSDQELVKGIKPNSADISFPLAYFCSGNWKVCAILHSYSLYFDHKCLSGQVSEIASSLSNTCPAILVNNQYYSRT